MGWFILGLFLAGLLYFFASWYTKTSVVLLKKALFVIFAVALVAILVVAIFLIIRGNAALTPVLVAVIPALWRIWASKKSSSKYSASQFESQNTSESLSRNEALEILGLKEGATDKEIIEAYKKLMVNLHPDAGGSNWMAVKLNEAKDFLLKK